jgi:MFS family permease
MLNRDSQPYGGYNSPHMSKRAAWVLIACFLTVFSAYAIRYSYGVLLPEMLKALDINKAQAGAIYSSYFIAYTLFSPVLGILSDRYDMRILISIFVALMGLGTFLMQYSNSIWQASLFFTIAGIGCAACWAPVMAIVQRWAATRRRGLIMAMVDIGSTLGAMAAGFLLPLVVVNASWKTGWLILGTLAIVMGFVDYLAIRNQPQVSPNQNVKKLRPGIRISLREYKQLFSDRKFWLIGLAYLMTGFAVMVPFTFISTFAIQERGFSFTIASLLVTTIGTGGLIGKVTLGPISDRLGRLVIMLVCALLISGGCLGIALGHGWMVFLTAAVFGIGYGACWPMYAAAAADYFSPRAAGGIIGLWTFFLGIGLLISPIAAGWIGDHSGSLRGGFWLGSVAGALSFVFLMVMWAKRKPGLPR